MIDAIDEKKVNVHFCSCNG